MEVRDGNLSKKNRAEPMRMFEQYQLALESTPNAIIIANEKGEIVLANQRAEQLFGYHRSELMGQLIEIIVPERFRSKHPGQRQSFMAAPSARPMGIGRDLYALRKDGTEFPVEIGLNPVKTEEGFYVLAAIADITLRKQAEESLLKSRERFRHMVENLPAGAVHVEGDNILFNKAAEEITGYSNLEITNLKDWFKALYGKEHEKILNQYEEDKKAGFPAPRTVQLKRKDGQARFVEFAVYKDEKAEVWLLHDVTERKRLEKMVLEVTKKEQQRIGEELHEGLAQHLTMTAIAGKILAQKLSGKSPSLGRQASKVTGMVNQAITQTRELAQGLYSLHLQSDGFTDALKKFASDTQKTCNIRCIFQCDPKVNVTDNAVAAHVYRIVREAVSNAIKHAKAKSIMISLKSKDKGIAELKISNSGAKFKPRNPGYEGMGLKIMRSRAKIIGANLNIGPRPKGGTVVTCTFPNR